MSETAVADVATDTPVVTESATTPAGATTVAADATAPAKADAPANADTPAADAAVPITYAFTAPDGVTLDTALVEAVTPLFAAAKIAPDAAQQLVDAYAAHTAAQDAAMEAALVARDAAWTDAVKADPVLGGANLPATIAASQRVIHQFGGAALVDALNETRLGNHPALVTTFAKIAAVISEDTTIRSASGGTPLPARAADVLFPTMATKE